MKRLFFSTTSLDDAEAISDEVHNIGIDDHHFYVLSRDEKGIQSHHLHGSASIDKTDIIAAKKRFRLIALTATLVAFILLSSFTNLFSETITLALVFAYFAYLLFGFISSIAGGSFDSYFKTMFNEKLDSGEVIIVIDVDKNQADKVLHQLDEHKHAQFLADSYNFASPIPD